MAGRDVSTNYVEHAAEALGRDVAEDERLVVEPREADEPLGHLRREQWAHERYDECDDGDVGAAHCQIA